MNANNSPRHRILITNDDGIHARGIEVLEEIARGITDDVWVVAPDHEKSGASHSVSLTIPIRMRQLGEQRYQISGTPTDCVLMAVCEFMQDGPPTMIMSGINSGANLAEDISYSGTIAAAMEGTLLGIRSIALSQIRPLGGQADFAAAEKHAPDLINSLFELDQWPAGSFININFPDAPPEQVEGVRVTTQGQRLPGTFSIDSRIDARAPALLLGKDHLQRRRAHRGNRSTRRCAQRNFSHADQARLHRSRLGYALACAMRMVSRIRCQQATSGNGAFERRIMHPAVKYSG